MKRFLLYACFLLLGCNPLVCRHAVMSHAAWAEEQGLNYRIVVYEVPKIITLGIYDSHAQVKTEKGWISAELGLWSLSDEQTFPMSGWSKEYGVEEYMRLMRKNCFNSADCRDEKIPY